MWTLLTLPRLSRGDVTSDSFSIWMQFLVMSSSTKVLLSSSSHWVKYLINSPNRFLKDNVCFLSTSRSFSNSNSPLLRLSASLRLRRRALSNAPFKVFTCSSFKRAISSRCCSFRRTTSCWYLSAKRAFSWSNSSGQSSSMVSLATRRCNRKCQNGTTRLVDTKPRPLHG
jgi:hypothetical protein